MKEKKMYDKPLLKVMEIELNECIANSFKVSEGKNLHEGLNGEPVDKKYVGSFTVDWKDDWN